MKVVRGKSGDPRERRQRQVVLQVEMGVERGLG
jgi:hypothetical protein